MTKKESNKEIKKPNRTQYIALFGSIILISIVLILHKTRKNRLYQNFEITEGRILKLTTGQSKTLQFKIDNYNPKYNPSMGVTFPSCRKNIHKRMRELQKLRFPVIYEKGNMENHQILIFKSQYKRANLEIPENLKPIVYELSNCFGEEIE